MELYWKNATISDFLEADFFEYNVELFLDKDDKEPITITPEIYYKELFVKPKNQIQYEELKKSILDNRNSRVVFIEGFAGCGKSTLVNKIFFDIVQSEGDADYIYDDFNYKLANSRYDYNQGANTCPNSEDEVNALIREGLANKMTHVILGDKTPEIGKDIYQVFASLSDSKHVHIIDKSRVIQTRLVKADVVKRELTNIKKKGRNTDLADILRDQLLTFNTQLLLAADFLWRLSQYIVTRKRHYLFVAYDNMDAIDYPEVLEKFDDHLIAFIKNLNSFITKIRVDLIKKYGINKPIFSILVTYRKITSSRVHLKSKYTEHEVVTENKDDSRYIVKEDVSDYFDYCKIVKSKSNYFLQKAKEKGISSDVINKLMKIDRISETKIICTDYKAFWNHNFRGCVNVMKSIMENRNSCIKKSLTLLDENCDEENKKQDINVCVFTGASSILLRMICDLFENTGIFGNKCLNLLQLNEASDYGYTTLSRLILNYYYTKKRAPINQLFAEFEGVFEAEDIAKALAHLLDKNDIWRRPLYYTGYAISNSNLGEELLEQAKHFTAHDSDFNHYTELELCPCGKLYIEMIVTSFEFFACRCVPKSKPLYCEEEYSNIVMLIDRVYESVKNCCENLKKFREEYIDARKIDEKKFLELPIHPVTYSGKKQLHEERIIFHHISYLEMYRCIVLKHNTDENKMIMNTLLVDKIADYLALYNDYIRNVDPQRNDVAVALEEAVKTIKNSEYRDFTTKIERHREDEEEHKWDNAKAKKIVIKVTQSSSTDI